MREHEFQARDKKVQKMTRDGLVEQNLTRGTQERVSGREADMPFAREAEKGSAGGCSVLEELRGQGARGSASPVGQEKENPESREAGRQAERTGSGNLAGKIRAEDGESPGHGEAHRPERADGGNRTKVQTDAPVPGRTDRMGERAGQSAGRRADAGDSRGGAGNRLHFRDGEVSGNDAESAEPGRAQERFGPGQREESRGNREGREDKERFRRSRKTGERDAETRNGRNEDRNAGSGEGKTGQRTDRDAGSGAEKDGGKTGEKSGGGSESNAEKADRKTENSGRQGKRYEKARRRVETAEKRLERARARIPTRKKARLWREYDPADGKVRHRLRFEQEMIPEGAKPPLPKRAGAAVVRSVSSAVDGKAHQKVREVEKDNVGVEAGHKAETAAERALGSALRWNRRRLRSKPYRELRRAERKAERAGADFAYRKFLRENPDMGKKAFSRWLQKQRIRKQYAASARAAAKGAGKAGSAAASATGKAARVLKELLPGKKTVLGVVALGIVLMTLSGSLLSSCSALFTGMQSSVVLSGYVAEDGEIERSELRYTEMETDLQKDIDNTEGNHPGYDEYRYHIGEIGHNPFELMGYLSAVYGDFTYDRVEAELERLFGMQYTLGRRAITERRTRTYLDENGEEQEEEYEYRILETTLTVRPLSEAIAGSLGAGEQTELYRVYMETCGNRQCYGNPFGFAWIPHVTSPYGYRVHPISGEKNLHRGIDIGAPAGTPIRAVQDGRVASAGDAGDYGLCIVIEGEEGYQSRYAHCASLSVGAGQEVRRGDVIATVGSTGVSTGPHLHLEVSHNGEYLNPYYFVDNGGDGYLPGGAAAGLAEFPDDPGQPMDSAVFAALLEEAEKYLGYPYVWGGSSPEESFDCSGYVSWAINHSGAGSVGRQTAQGLFNLCTPVARDGLEPGDLVFFTGTYSSASPVSHVGIYVGGGRMINAGDPICYTNMDSNYWRAHFYSGGRLP